MKIHKSKLTIWFILLFAISNILSETSYCLDHCLTDPCENLNGNITYECGDCNISAACNKYDLNYKNWFSRYIDFNILSNITTIIVSNITNNEKIIDTINDTIL